MFLKNFIHSDDSNDSNDCNEKSSTYKTEIEQIECIHFYLKNKRIARNKET